MAAARIREDACSKGRTNACTDIPTYNQLEWVRLGLSGAYRVDMDTYKCLRTDGIYSSAKDQLTGQAVAVKKIMKPFSTPVLSKRTYRELKLLKHLKHENVISLSDIFISPLEDMYVEARVLISSFAHMP